MDLEEAPLTKTIIAECFELLISDINRTGLIEMASVYTSCGKWAYDAFNTCYSVGFSMKLLTRLVRDQMPKSQNS